jgi:hypothetical protein
MSRWVKTSIRFAALCLLALPARAVADGCLLGGQTYPENATACSGGLVLFCSNGTWQTVEGQRCDLPSGAYVGARRPLEDKNAEAVPDYYKEKYPQLDLK